MIMPAYNAEKYLEEAIDSILKQTFDAYELVVVDDGSTDRTGEILDRYARQSEKVKVIHQNNSGVSAARNGAMSRAQGEFYYFMDSDDIAESNALELLYQAATEQDADIVIAKYDEFNQFGTYYHMALDALFETPLIDSFHPDILWTFTLWNKLFRAELVKKGKILFPAVSYSEDGVFLMTCVHHAKRITSIPNVIYHYRKMSRDESEAITASVSVAKIKDFIKAHGMIHQILKDAAQKQYPQYDSVEEIQKKVPEMDHYLNEFLRKEVQILIDQFYSRFWSLNDEAIELITEEIKRRISEMNMSAFLWLAAKHPALNLTDLKNRPEDVLEDSFFTVALYKDTGKNEAFLRTLKSLLAQSFIFIRIVVPNSAENEIRKNDLWRDNLFTIDETEKESFYRRALDLCQTPCILFADSYYRYAGNAFQVYYNRMKQAPLDYVSELIYSEAGGERLPILQHLSAYESVAYEIGDRESLHFDRFLPNHVFKTSFLRGILKKEGGFVSGCIPEIQKKGYLLFADNKTVFFQDDPEQLLPLLHGLSEKKEPGLFGKIRGKIGKHRKNPGDR